MKRLVAEITFHHVKALGLHLLHGVPSSLIAKMKTIWSSARYHPPRVFFQLGNFMCESEARCQQGFHHPSCWPFLQLEELGSETIACRDLFPHGDRVHLHSI